MKNYLDIQNLCRILLHYDELTHTEMCCEFHLNMYKKDFIGNMKTIQPNFDYQLLSLKMILFIISNKYIIVKLNIGVIIKKIFKLLSFIMVLIPINNKIKANILIKLLLKLSNILNFEISFNLSFLSHFIICQSPLVHL